MILLIATNAGLIGVSRLTYSMGQHRQLPEGLRQVHPRYRTPYIAILVFAAVAMITLLPGQTDFLATMYSFGAMLSFTIAHVAVIQLRRRNSRGERPWKPPLNFRAFGLELPLRAVLGGLGTFAAWIVVMALNPRTLAVGLGWMAFGIAVYVLYRRNQRLPLTETVKVADAGAARGRGDRVPQRPGRLRGRASRSPRRWSRPRSSSHPSAAAASTSTRCSPCRRTCRSTRSCPSDEAEAQSKIEQAKLIGGQRVTGHVERVRPGQAGY